MLELAAVLNPSHSLHVHSQMEAMAWQMLCTRFDMRVQRSPSFCYSCTIQMSKHSPVVHDSKFAIWWDESEHTLSIKSVQGHRLMEVAVVQHDHV